MVLLIDATGIEINDAALFSTGADFDRPYGGLFVELGRSTIDY
jgi:hypothetical protein